MEKSSFFMSINGDRKYKVTDFAEYFANLLVNGVFPNPSTNLQVLANNDMTVTLKAGPAWINGYSYMNTADLIKSIDVADGVLNRIDRLVLRYDTATRSIYAAIKKGVFASSPVAPVLQRDADAYELGIADIYVAAGAGGITQANITDLRLNSSYCGLVTFVVPIDVTAIFNQYQDWFIAKTGQYNSEMASKEAQFQAEFTIWFNTIKGQLGTDIAGSLQNQINTITYDYNFDVLTSDSNNNPTHAVYKRQDNTIYIDVVSSNPDSNGFYQTVVQKIYDFDGVTLLRTKTGTFTFNIDGVIQSKRWVVS